VAGEYHSLLDLPNKDYNLYRSKNIETTKGYDDVIKISLHKFMRDWSKEG